MLELSLSEEVAQRRVDKMSEAVLVSLAGHGLFMTRALAGIGRRWAHAASPLASHARSGRVGAA